MHNISIFLPSELQHVSLMGFVLCSGSLVKMNHTREEADALTSRQLAQGTQSSARIEFLRRAVTAGKS